MINNEKFAEVIYSILSINNSTKTALGLKCALYSVVLEMITNIISDENKDKLYFIQEKKLRKELQKNLNNHASEFFEKNEIGIYKDSPIKKRIDNLNSPTNQDKLLAPFKILEINLTESDKKILNNRNIFLHGNNPLEGIELEEQSTRLFYISLELNFLINALILKYIGYSGKVKNLSKIFLDYAELDENKDEEYYKII